MNACLSAAAAGIDKKGKAPKGDDSGTIETTSNEGNTAERRRCPSQSPPPLLLRSLKTITADNVQIYL
jgi:hypothetical protein